MSHQSRFMRTHCCDDAIEAAAGTSGDTMEGKRPSDKNLRSTMSVLALVGAIGLYIALPPVFGAFAGRYLDNNVFHDSAPLATILGLLLGLAVGIALAVRSVLRLS